MRIGKNYPEVFSSIYRLSPCCLGPTSNMSQDSAAQARVNAIRTPADLEKVGFFTKVTFDSLAAWEGFKRLLSLERYNLEEHNTSLSHIFRNRFPPNMTRNKLAVPLTVKLPVYIVIKKSATPISEDFENKYNPGKNYYRTPEKVSLRTDNGSLFEAGLIREYLQEISIDHEITHIATLQENCYIESFHFIVKMQSALNMNLKAYRRQKKPSTGS